jgi:hypothetical protein
MKECGRCHSVVPDTAMKCTTCGGLVVAPPPVPVRVGAANAQASDAAPRASQLDPFGVFGENPMNGVMVKPPPAPAARTGHTVGMVVAAVIVMLALATAAYPVLRSSDGSGTAASDAPVVLTPKEPMAGGIPGLSQAVRVQAESNRQMAFAAIMQARTAGDGTIDPALLQQAQPDITWLAAGESSTGPKEVSLADSAGVAVVAVSASNKTVCAFGRLPVSGVGEYVTMGNMHSCAATDAPAEGWTQLAGGYGGTPPLDP